MIEAKVLACCAFAFAVGSAIAAVRQAVAIWRDNRCVKSQRIEPRLGITSEDMVRKQAEIMGIFLEAEQRGVLMSDVIKERNS